MISLPYSLLRSPARSDSVKDTTEAVSDDSEDPSLWLPSEIDVLSETECSGYSVIDGKDTEVSFEDDCEVPLTLGRLELSVADDRVRTLEIDTAEAHEVWNEMTEAVAISSSEDNCQRSSSALLCWSDMVEDERGVTKLWEQG